MRISYLQQLDASIAEEQAFYHLKPEADKFGDTVFIARNADDILKQDPDFVLVSLQGFPKLTHHPHFGVLHEPLVYYEHLPHLENIKGWDGYVTIYEPLKEWITDRIKEWNKVDVPPGEWYATASPDESAPEKARATFAKGDLRMIYIGSNWDNREPELMKKLDAQFADNGRFEIYGRPEGWQHMNLSTWKGMLPFNRQSVDDIYTKSGIGLVVHSRLHLDSDIVSNRIFEMARSCCNVIMPWTSQTYKLLGDSVYYYDQRSVYAAKQIAEHFRTIWTNAPDVNLDKAMQVNQRTMQRYSQSELYQKLRDYYFTWKAAAKR